MGSKVKSAATVADRLIVFHAGIHAAFMLAEKDHYCPIDEALDYIAKLESAASPTASVEEVVRKLRTITKELRVTEGWDHEAQITAVENLIPEIASLNPTPSHAAIAEKLNAQKRFVKAFGHDDGESAKLSYIAGLDFVLALLSKPELAEGAK